VAFSKLTQADNVGYIIPWKIVAHFLREYEQYGTFRGCCSVGFRWQDMENTHLREHYQACPACLRTPQAWKCSCFSSRPCTLSWHGRLSHLPKYIQNLQAILHQLEGVMA
jgi:hypothetical protein